MQAVAGAAEPGSYIAVSEMARIADARLREELISALDYALRFKAPGLTWKRGQQSETLPRISAEAIVEQLELANFTFGRGEPVPIAMGHHGPTRASKTG
jgi:hypothetical protein